VAVIGLLERFLEHPAVYRIWQAPFARRKLAPVERHLRVTDGLRVLDVGCGPGTNAGRFSACDYVGIDINERYLAVARARYRGRFIQADLATADLSSLGSFDTILVNSFLHHLPDATVSRILSQISGLLAPSASVHVLELVLPEHWSLSRVMAKLDRGRYARSVVSWRDLLVSHFAPVVFETYSLGGLWAMVYFQGQARSCVSR
jgi:SAM-dependent methyltransferase